MTEPCLEVRQLSHAYQNKAVLHDIHLSVASHSIHYLLGASGCGKSTLLRLICGLEKPTHGSIACMGKTLSKAEVFVPTEDRKIGMVFQDLALFPHMTVLQNVTYGLGRSQANNHKKLALELLESMQIAHLAKAYPHTLSGGQAQRVALARSLAPKPLLLLLDEPFSGLDVHLKAQVREQTLEFLKQNRVTTVLVSHDPQEVMEFADFVTVMHQGRVMATGIPQDLFVSPPSAQVFKYFGQTCSLNVPSSLRQGNQVMMPWGPVTQPVREFSHEPLQWIYRPEAILPCQPDAEHACFTAHVLHIKHQGPWVHVTLNVQGWGDLFAKFPAQIPLVEAQGQGFWFSIDQKFSHVF